MSIDQGGPKRYALGVDFGTSNTVAVARWPDGRARPILVDGSPLLPSAVFADSDGTLLVGRDAVHSARIDPARFEPNPKRRIDDGLVLLGEREFEVVELIAAVLARVAEEWHRAVGPHRPEVTLTCPASWGASRRTLLAEAAAQAGLEGARLVAEPVAAATYFAEVLGRDVPIGSVVMVHDFGAGTFDTSVVARTSTGFEVLAVDGRDDLGGLDVDAAVVEHLQTEDWARLMEPATVEERRARRQLWDDVRIAKERLSRAQAADFVVPLLDVEAHLTREELETVARPVLEQTVQITQNLLRWADLPDGRLAGVFLVGGASRIPLVATLLHRALGDPPVVIEQPELVVAEGSILAGAALLTTEPAAPGPTEELRLPSKYLPVRAEEADADDRPTMIADKPLPVRVEEDRPTALVDKPPPRPATTPVPAVASEQGPEAHPTTVDEEIPAEVAKSPAPAAASAKTQVTAKPLPKRENRTPPPSLPQQPGRARPDTPPHLRPPVDPWPNAASVTWRPDPDATVATSPPEHESRTPLPPRQPGPQQRPQRTQPPRTPVQPARAQQPVVVPSRPVSPAVGSARPVSPPRATAAVPKPQPAPEPARVRRPRRKGRLRRTLQVLLSLLVMVTVPVVALILAYGYGNDDTTFEQDAIAVFKDIAQLIGIR
jgi:actin-like ATPase involved in cell morphogenesis